MLITVVYSRCGKDRAVGVRIGWGGRRSEKDVLNIQRHRLQLIVGLLLPKKMLIC